MLPAANEGRWQLPAGDRIWGAPDSSGPCMERQEQMLKLCQHQSQADKSGVILNRNQSRSSHAFTCTLTRRVTVIPKYCYRCLGHQKMMHLLRRGIHFAHSVKWSHAAGIRQHAGVHMLRLRAC